MKKEVWICVVHTFAQPSVVSSDGYSSLSKAQEALRMRLGAKGDWQDAFNFVQPDKLRRYELKCVTIED